MLCYICSWFCEQVLRARTSLHVAVKLEQTPSSAPTRLRLLVRNVDYASCMHSTKNIAGTLRCLQKEMVTYSHWSVSLWRDRDDVSHCRILSPDKTEWRLISATNSSADEDAVLWLTSYGWWHAYEKKKKNELLTSVVNLLLISCKIVMSLVCFQVIIRWRYVALTSRSLTVLSPLTRLTSPRWSPLASPPELLDSHPVSLVSYATCLWVVTEILRSCNCKIVLRRCNCKIVN